MSEAWRQQRERGSGFLIRFISWLSLNAGWSVGRLLLYPICSYFLVFSSATRKASRQYLTLILGRPVHLTDIFRHYHTFAATLLDRIFFLTNRFEDYEISLNGAEIVDAHLAAKRGCIMLGAHIGSFEVMQTLGTLREGLPLKVLMYPHNSRRFNAVRTDLNPRLAQNTIALGSPTAMIEVKEHLDNGGMVGMLGDRITHGDKLIRSRFLGKPVLLPEGPLLLASILKVPVFLMFGLYRGPRRYDIYFELFADSIVINRQTRHTDLQVWVDNYAQRLEHYCRDAPFNWFNFYEFWERDTTNS